MASAQQVALLLEPHSQADINAEVAALIDSQLVAGLAEADSAAQQRDEQLRKHTQQTLHAAQQKKAALDAQLEQSRKKTDAVLHSCRNSLDELVSSTTELEREHSNLQDDMISHHDTLVSIHNSTDNSNETLVERLESLLQRQTELERAKGYFLLLKKAEDLSLTLRKETETYNESGNISPVTKAYIDLVKYVQSIDPKLQPGAAKYGASMVQHAWTFIVKTLPQRLLKALETLQWPTPIQQQIDPHSSSKESALKESFVDLLKVQKAREQYNVENNQRKNIPVPLFAITALAEPLVLRFRYHFEGSRPTNRLDKPEWFFSHLSNVIDEHARFLRQDVQLFLKQGGYGHVSALNEFISALLIPVERKIRHITPQLLESPELLSHLIYATLKFDQGLRDIYKYFPRNNTELSKLSEWTGLVDIILSNHEWTTKWRDSEKEFFDEKYYEIIGSENAWQINSTYSDSPFKPTNSAFEICELFDQLTERYEPLPQIGEWLGFISEIQFPLLESYLSRITSSVDAFETLSYGIVRAVSVPGALGEGSGARMTSGITGLSRIVRAGVCARWMEQACKSWADDIHFLDVLEYIQNENIDEKYRKHAETLLNYTKSGQGGTLFSRITEQFQQLCARIEGLIFKHVNKQIIAGLKEYSHRDWRLTKEKDKEDEEQIVSADLYPVLSFFSSSLSLIFGHLPRLIAVSLCRKISNSIQDFLYERVVLSQIFSLQGGKQFFIDIERGWVYEQQRQYGIPPMQRVMDAGRLLSLGGNDYDEMVKAAWATDSTLEELLKTCGVKELVQRKSVQAVLRRRPECWKVT